MSNIRKDAAFGPCMTICTEQERTFVVAYLETGGRNHTTAAQIAGFGAGNNASARQQGWRLVHRPRVLAAIREEADKRLKTGAILGASVLIEIAETPGHKDQMKAAVELLNRAGLIVATKHEVEVTDNRTTSTLLARVHELAQRLDIDPRKLLGQATGAPQIVDAEFEDVERGADGLEDLL